MPAGFGVGDGVGLLYRERCLDRVVGSHPGVTCVRVRGIDGQAVEQPVPVEILEPPAPRMVAPDVREMRAHRRAVLRWGGSP